MNKTYRYAILGAGCAGLSLAWRLIEAGIKGNILILDRKSEFSNDRTWCFWDVEETPFSHLASHRWPHWTVIREDGAQSRTDLSRYHYLHIQGSDFYDCVLERLARSSRVELLLNASVLECATHATGVVIKTSVGSFITERVFDSTNRSGGKTKRGSHSSTFEQHFRGVAVQTEQPVFNPDCPVLMDFRTGQRDGPHFFYVLPLSATEAIVENTYLMPCAISRERHEQEIATYLKNCYGLQRRDYKVTGGEAGRIPMNPDLPVSPPSEPIVRIGLAGAAARPSTGYAFLRIQRHCRWLAQNVAAGKTEGRNPLFSRRRMLLDRVFLQALSDRPENAGELFYRLFNNVPLDSLPRFLSDCGTSADELAVIHALPAGQFARAAIRYAKGLIF